MSTTPESGSREFELDLDLHFLPAWAQKPSTENTYAKYEGGDDRRPRFGDRREARRGDRPPRRDGGRPQRSDARGDRRGGPRRDREGGARPPERPRYEAPTLPIDLTVSIIPEDKGVESLARQIRLTGRAYPLFDIAFLILKKPDRYNVRYTVNKKPDAQTPQCLYLCDLDETIWVTEQEATDHVLNKFFSTFYEIEKTPSDPPKGTYTFVAQCGVSGTILGPPNYHDYQNKVRKLHAERFSRMPFEAYKSRIKIVRDEAIVKKWLEDQSWKIEYVCLNMPDPLKLGTREEVERHFRETHLPNVIKRVESHTVSGAAVQGLPSRSLQSLARRAWEEQNRFPLKVVNVLSQQFASHGLQFFKVNKTVTHVAAARPRYLDLDVTPVSEGIKRIVEFIRTTPNCSRRKILEALAPGVPLQPTPSTEPGTAEVTPPTPEAAAVVADLHWLIHEGHVIEFANGVIELAKRPAPRPPKPEPAKNAQQGAASAASAASAGEGKTAEVEQSDEAAAGEVTGEEHGVADTAERNAPAPVEASDAPSDPERKAAEPTAPAETAPVEQRSGDGSAVTAHNSESGQPQPAQDRAPELPVEPPVDEPAHAGESQAKRE